MTDDEIIMKLATLAHQTLSRKQGEVDALEALACKGGRTKTYLEKAIREARDKAISPTDAYSQNGYEYYMGYADALEDAQYWLERLKVVE